MGIAATKWHDTCKQSDGGRGQSKSIRWYSFCAWCAGFIELGSNVQVVLRIDALIVRTL